MQSNTTNKTAQGGLLDNKGLRLFLVLGGFFIANALSAEFMGVKIFSLERSLGLMPAEWPIFGGTWNFDLTAGVLLWPVVFIMTDVINEYYGSRGVKFLSWLGAGLISYAYFMFYTSIHLVPAPWWPSSQSAKGIADLNLAYSGIFGQGTNIIIASLAAFILSQILDVTVFHAIKRRTGERYLWLRSTGSTLFSQFIDTFVVTSVAFYFIPIAFPTASGGQQPWAIGQLLTVCAGGYLYKAVVAFAMTPVIYGVHYAIERYLGPELSEKMKKQAIGQAD